MKKIFGVVLFPLACWGTPGSGNNNFNGPVGLAVNSDGTTVYVGDALNDQVKHFTAQ